MLKKIIFIFCFLPLCLFAQKSNTSSVRQAQKSYEKATSFIYNDQLELAINELNKAIELDSNFIAAFQQLGDSYRKTGNYYKAIINYTKVLKIDPEFYPLTYFSLAESELNTGDYSNSILHFEKYSKFPGISASSVEITRKYLIDCRFSLEALNNPVPFKPINIGPAINTEEDEYLPIITADEETIIFTRQVARNEDFYTSKKQNKEWANAAYLSKNINTANYNEGAQSISPDGKYLFFTACNRPDALGRCDIYLAKREGNDWTEPFNIGEPINTSGWESQPSISADGRTLYFISNRKGGLGGYDIWSSELNDDESWTVPVNLGPNINTKYDEISPFIHPDNESLYFASDGWPGFGNKDLFISRKIKTTENQTEWSKPENLGFPINTSTEESGLSVSHNGKKAYFSSKQKDGFGKLDIYYFELPENLKPKSVSYVKGKVFDKIDNQELNAHIIITDLISEKTVFDDFTEFGDGLFLASLVIDRNYGLTIKKDGYLFYSQNFLLNNDQKNEAFFLEIPLERIEIGKMVVLNNIFFNSNEYNLLPESKTELKQLIVFLKENPKVSIEIGGHTDDIGDDESNLMLSKNRAKTVFDYLINNTIPANKLSFKGYGESRPLSNKNTENGRKMNRRTEFKITNK
jgi:outer membrane protein OmpA-like peptidoglycan-associated protein/Tol biopolymer transport system component